MRVAAHQRKRDETRDARREDEVEVLERRKEDDEQDDPGSCQHDQRDDDEKDDRNRSAHATCPGRRAPLPHAVQPRVDAGVQAEHRGGGERCAGGIGDRPESVLEGAHGIDLVKTVRGEHELCDAINPKAAANDAATRAGRRRSPRTIAYTAAVIAAAITVPINASAAIAGRSPPDRGNRTVAAMATAAAAPIVSQPARESVRPRADSV